MRRFGVGALALLLAATACSKGSDTANPKRDAAKAARLVLLPEDLPDGFAAREHKVDAAEKQSEDDLAACLHLPPASAVNDADERGKDFVRGLGTESQSVRSAAFYAKSSAAVSSATRATRSQQFKDCVKATSAKLFTARSPSIQIDGLQVDDRSFPSYGDATTGYRLHTTISVAPTSLDLFADVVVYTKGRARVTATFTAVGKPFPDADEAALAKLLGKRLERRG